MDPKNSFQKWLPWAFGLIVLALLATGAVFWLNSSGTGPTDPQAPKAAAAVTTAPQSSPVAAASPQGLGQSMGGSPSPTASGFATAAAPSSTNVDLTVDSNGMSKATVVMTTTQGLIKFKFYPQDAPKTVARIAELINKGFYNGLTFHRVVPGFVIQGGDPTGTGTGGSGLKLKAEFNDRHHVEGTVAMARAQDPDSADSQFYIALGTLTRLDHNYTVFGQVIEGMDAVRKIKIGDKIVSAAIQ